MALPFGGYGKPAATSPRGWLRAVWGSDRGMRLNERLSVIADLDVDGADLRAAALGELDECAVCVDTECTHGRAQVRREQSCGRDGFLVARCGAGLDERRGGDGGVGPGRSRVW